ncbi:MAG: DNA-binding response regulator, LuxR family, near polyamine transporter [Rhodocyclaceae bacterium]|nr:DNA-binding response regulator, LuxR family, near polyamine transporter [Rhodocyclaceae bacterium]
MIRVMLAEDHALMREGLKHLFAMVDDIAVVAEADNGAAVLDRVRDGGIDLLLLDMTMPGISGEDLVARVRNRYPTLPILILSMRTESQIAQRTIKAGANGYLTKDIDPDTLIQAIRKVAAGRRFLDPMIAEQMAFDATGMGASLPHQCLTDRESQVLRLIARGIGVNGIADQLAISNKTVSTHKARLMEKMGFASNAELVRYAVLHGLVD